MANEERAVGQHKKHTDASTQTGEIMLGDVDEHTNGWHGPEIGGYITTACEVAWRIQSALASLHKFLSESPAETVKRRRLHLFQAGLSHEMVSALVSYMVLIAIIH